GTHHGARGRPGHQVQPDPRHGRGGPRDRGSAARPARRRLRHPDDHAVPPSLEAAPPDRPVGQAGGVRALVGPRGGDRVPRRHGRSPGAFFLPRRATLGPGDAQVRTSDPRAPLAPGAGRRRPRAPGGVLDPGQGHGQRILIGMATTNDSTEPKRKRRFGGKNKPPRAPNNPGRWQQVKQVWTMTRKYDPASTWWMLLAALAVLLVARVIGLWLNMVIYVLVLGIPLA